MRPSTGAGIATRLLANSARLLASSPVGAQLGPEPPRAHAGFPNGPRLKVETDEEVAMARLVRLDSTGHTTLAEWSADDAEAHEAAVQAFRRELDRGMIGSMTMPDGSAEVVRELPADAGLVVMRRQIAGG
jgi:hypothetical protein